MKKAYVLEGNSSQRREVKNRLKESMSGCEIFFFDKEDRLDSMIQRITEVSCFDGDLRLFIIKEIPSADDSNARTKAINAFQKMIPNIPDRNVVVFDNLNISSKKVLDVVEKYGKVFVFDQKISETQAKNKLVDYCEKNEKSISEENIISFLKSLTTSDGKIDVDEMNILILKLEHYIGPRKNITNEDIYNICSHSKEFIIWYLYELFDKKDFCRAIFVAEDMLSRNKDIQTEIYSFLSQMIWRYRLIYMARCGLSNKKSVDEIKKEISSIVKLERSGQSQKMSTVPLIEKEEKVSQYSDGMLYTIFNSRGGNKSPVNCYSLEQLELINYALYKALLKVRVGCTKSEICIIIEFVLMTICDQIKKCQTLDILDNKKILSLEFIENDQ